MTVPARIVLERSSTQVFLAFDQDITRVSGALPWDNGFTLTVNAVPTVISAVTKVANGIWFDATFTDSDTVALAYAGTNLVDALTSTDPVAAFATTTAPLFWLNGSMLRSAIIAAATPTTITLSFRDPVASVAGNLKAGLSMTINAIPVSLATATVTGTGRTVTIVTTADFAYDDDVVVEYDSGTGDWYDVEENTPVVDFTATVTNASKSGSPASDYPLSTVISNPLSISGNTVTASLSVSLNSIDRELVTRYAPTFDQGGYYGLPTVNPPTGYFVPGLLLAVRDGQTYSYAFTVVGNTQWASLAARDWLDTMVVRIGQALATVRALDQTITLGSRTITQV